jgi:hypothetical protein
LSVRSETKRPHASDLSRPPTRADAARTVATMTDRRDDETPEQHNPTGGDETTEEELDSDNAVEDDMLKTLDPDDSPA